MKFSAHSGIVGNTGKEYGSGISQPTTLTAKITCQFFQDPLRIP
jgi:hypothetical protein